LEKGLRIATLRTPEVKKAMKRRKKKDAFPSASYGQGGERKPPQKKKKSTILRADTERWPEEEKRKRNAVGETITRMKGDERSG